MDALISLAEGREGFEALGVVEGEGVLTGFAMSDDFEELLVGFGGVLLVVLREFVAAFEDVEDLEALVGFEAVEGFDLDDRFAACWRIGEPLIFKGVGGGEGK